MKNFTQRRKAAKGEPLGDFAPWRENLPGNGEYRFVCESCGRKHRKQHAVISKGLGIGLSVCGWCFKPLLKIGWKDLSKQMKRRLSVYAPLRENLPRFGKLRNEETVMTTQGQRTDGIEENQMLPCPFCAAQPMEASLGWIINHSENCLLKQGDFDFIAKLPTMMRKWNTRIRTKNESSDTKNAESAKGEPLGDFAPLRENLPNIGK